MKTFLRLHGNLSVPQNELKYNGSSKIDSKIFFYVCILFCPKKKQTKYIYTNTVQKPEEISF